MRLLNALRFPLCRPLRLIALALVQSLFLWLMIAALDGADGYPGNLETSVIVILFCGSVFFNAFWLHGTSVASLQRAVMGEKSLAPLCAADFRPRGIGPAIASLLLMACYLLFLALAEAPAQVSRIVPSLGFVPPKEALSLVVSHMLVIGIGSLVSLMFFVSLARYAAEGVGFCIDPRSAGLFHPRKNLAATARYLLRQLSLLGLAAIAFDLGLQFLSAVTPSALGLVLVDAQATNWLVFSICLSCAVVLYFWHASLYLLADYVLETSI